MTNFEAIKEMSLDQASDLIDKIGACDFCAEEKPCRSTTEVECRNGPLAWLWQEVPEPPKEMTINEYQKLAMRTDNPRDSITENMVDGLLGLNGEAGEAADILKKHIFQGHDFSMKEMIEELGDVAWYLAKCCTAMGIPMETVFTANIEKLKRRYPEGFDSERSVNRVG